MTAVIVVGLPGQHYLFPPTKNQQEHLLITDLHKFDGGTYGNRSCESQYRLYWKIPNDVNLTISAHVGFYSRKQEAYHRTWVGATFTSSTIDKNMLIMTTNSGNYPTTTSPWKFTSTLFISIKYIGLNKL